MPDFVVRVGPDTGKPEFTSYFVGLISGLVTEVGPVENAARYASRNLAEKQAASLPDAVVVETDVPFVERRATVAGKRNKRRSR